MSIGLNLVEQLNKAQEELNAEYQKGGTANAGVIEQLRKQIEDLTYEIDMEKRLEQHNERVEETQAEIVNWLDNMKVDGMNLRELFNNSTAEQAEAAYQIVSIAIKQAFMDESEKNLNEIKALGDQLAESKSEVKKLQELNDELATESAKYRAEINSLTFDLEQEKLKLDAAARQLEEAKAEIERLNSHNDDLQKQIAVGAANAVKVIDIGTNTSLEKWKELKRQEEAAKPAIYDVKPLDNKQSRFSAKLAATDEPIEYGYLEKGKYREVTAEEAEVFRAEYAAKEAERDKKDLALGDGGELTLPAEPQFQIEETEDEQHGMDEGDVHGTLERTSVETLEARITALEVAVFGKEHGAA